MDLLVKKDNIKAVRKALSSLPKSLDSIYDEAIQRIRSQDEDSVERAEQILAWLAYASRPLSLTAIRHALAVEDGDEDFDEYAMPDEETLVSICAGLVSIEMESKIIQLVHYTTQEYLRRLETTRFLQAPAMIAATCLRYLSFGAFADGPCPSDEHMEKRMQEYPFLDYAARHWGDHARGKPEEKVEELALKFLKQDAKLGCSVQAMHLPAYRYHGYSQSFPRRTTSLHLAASFGLATIIRLLLESTGNNDVDMQDSNGKTPLSLVAEKGYLEAAIPVLQHGASVAMKDNRGWTALHWACKQGHEPMARLLVEHGVDVSAKDKQGATALYWAAEKGHEATVRLLLENGAEVNLREGRGITPLQGASSSGHEGVVRLLLDKGAEIDAKDDYFGRTALHRAAGGGHVGVLQLLLGHGADVNATNNWGRTALHRATGAGREAVTRLLLEHRADTSLKETAQGATALHGAADGGHTTVMSLLIENGADVAARNDEKWATPLHWAARRGHEKAVLLLVEHGAEVAARDKSGMTALHEAAANGRDGVARLLLDWIDIETKDNRGATPLHWAAAGGHEAAALMLLEKGANARATDNEGRTALHYAAEAKNTSGTNALHRAAKEGNVAVMRSLLANGADVNSRDSTGATALHWAAAWGHELAVRLLLENGVEVMAADGYGWTALHRAANDRHGGSSRHEAATWLLLEKLDVGVAGAESGDSKTISNAGKPVVTEDDPGIAQKPIVEPPLKILAPLPNAATVGHTEVAQLLLSSGADAGMKDCTGKTALDEALQSGHDAMVLLLLRQ
jgi:ankyrin repeat protein